MLEGRRMSAASSSTRANKPLASALGNSLAVLLEECMAPLRARLASVEQQCAQQAQDRLLSRRSRLNCWHGSLHLKENETMEMQTHAALAVQTKAPDQRNRGWRRLRHTKHAEHSDRTFQILEENLAKAQAQHAETFSELQEHQRETAAMHATHADAIGAPNHCRRRQRLERL